MAYFDSRRDIGKRRRPDKIFLKRNHKAEYGQHDVASASHVVNFAGRRRDVEPRTLALTQVHSITVERNQARLSPKLVKQKFPRFAPSFGVGHRHAGCGLGLETVGSKDCRTTVE